MNPFAAVLSLLTYGGVDFATPSPNAAALLQLKTLEPRKQDRGRDLVEGRILVRFSFVGAGVLQTNSIYPLKYLSVEHARLSATAARVATSPRKRAMMACRLSIYIYVCMYLCFSVSVYAEVFGFQLES